MLIQTLKNSAKLGVLAAILILAATGCGSSSLTGPGADDDGAQLSSLDRSAGGAGEQGQGKRPPIDGFGKVSDETE
ncbi:MAG: hypothetical protein IT349_15695 [Candidatus Eisenbacteria bacterium]|nr:hypothetical protein [Candidatus Eisenbacteria bacterium]